MSTDTCRALFFAPRSSACADRQADAGQKKIVEKCDIDIWWQMGKMDYEVQDSRTAVRKERLQFTNNTLRQRLQFTNDTRIYELVN